MVNKMGVFKGGNQDKCCTTGNFDAKYVSRGKNGGMAKIMLVEINDEL
jgi:hypothetical protein